MTDDGHRDEWAAAAEDDDVLYDGLDEDGRNQDDAPPLPGLYSRVSMVIFSPGHLFPRLAARPAWFGATVVVAAFGALAVFLPSTVPGLPSGQGAEGFDGATIARVATLVLVLPFALIGVLIASGFTYVALVFIRGDEATFRQHLSVISHSMVLSGLGSVALLAMSLMGLSPGPETLTVGGLLPFLPDGFLSSFLGKVQLFGLWFAVVAGLGLSLLDPRRRWGPTAAVTVGMTLVGALIVTVVTSAFL